MKFSHDSDGKIYHDGKFCFEVLISDGDAVARQLNRIFEIEHKACAEELKKVQAELTFKYEEEAGESL